MSFAAGWIATIVVADLDFVVTKITQRPTTQKGKRELECFPINRTRRCTDSVVSDQRTGRRLTLSELNLPVNVRSVAS